MARVIAELRPTAVADNGPARGGLRMTLDGRVLLVEELGATNLVHVNFDEAPEPPSKAGLAGRTASILSAADLLAILDGEFETEPNQPITLSVPETCVHFFEPETGAAV